MARIPAELRPIPNYGTGRILVDTHLYLPSYSDTPERVTFVVDTGATATVLAFKDWSRIIPSTAWDSLPVNTSAVSIGGTSYGSHTGAEIRFRDANGQPAYLSIPGVFLNLDRNPSMPSLLGMDVMMGGGLTFSTRSGLAELDFPTGGARQSR